MARKSPAKSRRPFSSIYQALLRGLRLILTTLTQTFGDPTLPLLVLGVIGAALFAVLVFKASAEVAFGILFIGCLTAMLETKAGRDRDR